MTTDGWQPTRWWRVIYRRPGTMLWQVWAESSDEQDVRSRLASAPAGPDGLVKLQQYYRREESEWREVAP